MYLLINVYLIYNKDCLCLSKATNNNIQLNFNINLINIKS